jgi:hypothetical protein
MIEDKNLGESPISFLGNEINIRAKTSIEAGVPGALIESGDFSPKLKVVSGQFASGQKSFNNGVGFFLGIEESTIKFSLGNGSTEFITWDGSKINIRANTVKTVFTQHISGTSERLSTDVNDSTTAHVGLSYTPHGIIVNRITLRSGGAAITPGVFKIGVYSEDGQTKLIDTTTNTISATYTYQTIILGTPVYLPPGVYYTVVVGVSTVSASFMGWKSPLDDDTYNVVGGKVTSGYMTVTSGTLPTSFDPVNSIIFAHNRSIVLRFDNI